MNHLPIHLIVEPKTSSLPATGFGSTITYTYDQVGNLVKTVAGTNTTNFVYGAYNRLTSWGGVSYTYDANGNRITKSGGWTYSYDYENRLAKAAYSGSTVQQDSYDGDGNLVKNVESDTRVFTYQGLNILYEKDTTTGIVTKHFYAGGMQVAKMVGATNYYMRPDALGSTRLVMTATLTVQFSSDYKPYGLTYSMTGVESFKYTGKMSDSVTGLYYFGARWYDPAVGRFATQDSYNGTKNDPLSQNRYIYAEDNPEKYVDPDGHMFYEDSGGGAVKVSIVSGIITTAFTSASTSTTAVSSGGSTTYTMTTTSTTVTCAGGHCTTSTSYSYTTWTTMSNPTETGPGGASVSDAGELSSVALAGQIGSQAPNDPPASCRAAPTFCSVLSFGGNDAYAKILRGSAQIFGGVGALVILPYTSIWSATYPAYVPAAVGAVVTGGMLLFSGSAQLGYQFGEDYPISLPKF